MSSVAKAKLTLYSYWRSSCSQRVRIALNLKEFEKINPVKYVPALVDGDTVVSDSFAIILVASIVSSSIQPLQNIPVLGWIESKFDANERLKWAQHHINKGFIALEKLLKDCAGKYATGDEVQLADVFLEPQIYAGVNRFQIDMSPYPTLARLHEAYSELPAFQAALPERQPDAPSSS
ncbi:Glutathione S-transferase Z1 [Cocos nucifera]|nr:Glutathione S-transferase Z1 [Cocos nucifera]